MTIDAIGTQTNIAQSIIEAKAGYVLSVKENQGHFFEDVSVLFAVDQAQDFKYASFEHEKPQTKDMAELRCENAGTLLLLNT